MNVMERGVVMWRALVLPLIIGLASLAFLGSCGKASGSGEPASGDGPAGATVSASAVVLTEPPVMFHKGRVGSCFFESGSKSNALLFDGLNVRKRIRFPGTHVLLAKSHSVGGVDYLVVGLAGVDGTFGLNRLHDADGDWIPDTSTTVSLLKLSPTFYFTDFAEHQGEWFFLDRRCQDIWRASNIGTWPTGIDPAPFARGQDHPELVGMRSIASSSAAEVSAFAAQPSSASFHNEGSMTFTDSNSDGMADSVALSPVPHLVVGTRWLPYNGQASLTVFTGETGSFEVWLLDSSGAESSQLGAGTLSTWGQPLSISLSNPLSEDDRIRIRETSEATGFEATVKAADPQIGSLPILRLTTGLPTVLTLDSVELEDGECVILLEPASGDDTPVSATYTVDQSTGAVTVNVPALPSSWEGICLLKLMDSAATSSDSAISILEVQVSAAP